ncbi:MAG: hypothetical protein U9Q96_03010 [Patescibacteria group bacterium]|nr:hypothetical protein [Patescibacteria group bacterium]
MDNKTLLLKQKRRIFSTDDLALIWNIKNRNTLRITILRYVKNDTLIRIKKGLYSTVSLNEIDPYLLGVSYVKGFCYVSMQSVLAIHGLINQNIKVITLIGTRSQKFKIGEYAYISKKMKLDYLNNLEGIDLDGKYPIASPERAVADLLYFNSKFHFDSKSRIDWNRVKQIKEKVFL